MAVRRRGARIDRPEHVDGAHVVDLRLGPQRPQREPDAVLEEEIPDLPAQREERRIARAVRRAPVEPERQQPKTVARSRVGAVVVEEPRQPHPPGPFASERLARRQRPAEIPRIAVRFRIDRPRPQRPRKRHQFFPVGAGRVFPERPRRAEALVAVAIRQPRRQRTPVGFRDPRRRFGGPRRRANRRKQNQRTFPPCGKKFSTVWKTFPPPHLVAGYWILDIGHSPPSPHVSSRPLPAVPTNCPPRTMISPRTVTTSGAPTTSKPS